MMKIGLQAAFDLLIGAGALQGFFLAAVLLAGRKRAGPSNLALAGLMALFSLNIIHAVFLRGSSSLFSARDRLIYEPLQYLFGPFVYFYVRGLAGKASRIRPRDIPHFLPFAFLALPFVFEPISGAAFPLAGFFNLLLWGGAIIQLVAYLWATARAASLHDKELRNLSSTKEGDIAWISGFLTVFLGICVIDFLLIAWTIHGRPLPYFYKVQTLALAAAVYGLGFRALIRPPAAVPGPEHPVVETEPAVIGKYGRSGFSREEADRMAVEIAAFMDREKPYLDPNLSLPELARMSGISRNRLSRALNESLGKNFYDFVNAYRVDEFKRLVAESDHRDDKILTLALEAGFNSKPAFNAVFRKACGLTPSEYRANARP